VNLIYNGLTMITEIYAYESAPSSYQAALFLAGPTPRNSDAVSWRPEALALLHQLEPTLDLVVFIPEPRDGYDYNDYLQQVTWEQQHLEMADAILVWLPRDMNTSLKGLTTNIEFGKYIDSGKLFYGRPEQADHIRYLDWLYTNTTARTPQAQLDILIAEILTYLTAQLESSPIKTRLEGERFVPLLIWQSPLFQVWYQQQQHVGNQLLKAKLLWVFILNKLNFTFAYALHVDIWIKAEDRVKSNEFIISRPDISVVIPYWRHPTDIMKSEIVLIREFRTPGRTADGFVYELPGGSTFGDPGDPLKLASCELEEETSLSLAPHRFRHLGSKQLAATWSTHYAQVYAVALDKQELEHAKQLAASGQSFGVQTDTEKTYVHVFTLDELSHYVDWAMEGMIYHAIIKA